MKSFNVLDRNQEIHRDYLLEASAGTGKTFSIENLVVRLLLEGEALEKILVVTFTREATYDLKVRIRYTIENSIKLLKLSDGPDYLLALIERGEQTQAQQRLQQALFSFDQAQIFTIHSFCSKILRENVFESDIGIEAIKGDRQVKETEILTIIRDFFRTSLDRDFISPAQLEIVLRKHRGSIENLERSLLRHVTGNAEIISKGDFETLFERFKSIMPTINLKGQYVLEDYALLQASYKKMDDSHQKVKRFATLLDKTTWNKEDLDLLIEDGLHLVEFFEPGNLKLNSKLPSNEILHYPMLVETLKGELYSLVEEARNYPLIYARMASLCQKMVWKYLEEEEKFRFDDLLKMVLKASENEHFVQKIQSRYRIAIIDEFQDTDPIQWEIFKRLFHKKCTLYLVGDPKQSIYAFRQADIYTYLSAAETLGNEHHASLDTNFRSQPSLVRALNALFDQKHTPGWIALPKIHSSLEYPAVKASSKTKESGLPDALHFFIAEDPEGKGKQETYESNYFFPYILQEIGLLKMNLSRIAVLVKDHRQAERLATYLKEQSISCLLQRSQSLVNTPAHSAWKELLEAVLSPRDESKIKKALGGSILAWSHAEVLCLEDVTVLEEALAQFYRLRRILLTEGFASFYENLLTSKRKKKDLSLAEHILSRQGGEQLYNDFQQIGDLLIEEQIRVEATPEALLRYLDTFEALDINQDENLKKRCNRNQEGVRILTIHSSKGLEFDVVFALGLVNRTPRDELLIPSQQTLIPVSDPQSSDYLNYLQELDAEKMRQLYVALTRAKHRLYVPMLYGRKAPEIGTASPMELFLARLGQSKHEDLYKNIKGLTKENLLHFVTHQSEMGYSLLNAKEFTFAPRPIPEKISLKAPDDIHFSHKPQYLLSFTTLAKSFHHEYSSELRPPHDFNASIKNVHSLPSGILTGVLLHEIFEKVPFEKLDDPDTLKMFIKNHLAGSLFEEWEKVIYELVINTLHAPLKGFCLAEVNPLKIYRETEFLYPHENGFLKGVIDFAFEYQSKYYLIDWKSNWLGSEGKDYTADKMKETMKKHDYFLQARIYQEALRRYVNLIEERSFEECFGGTFYLFLRGIDPKNEGQGVYCGIS